MELDLQVEVTKTHVLDDNLKLVFTKVQIVIIDELVFHSQLELPSTRSTYIMCVIDVMIQKSLKKN